MFTTGPELKKPFKITLAAIGIGALVSSFTIKKKQDTQTPIPPLRGKVHPNGRFNTMRSGGMHGAVDIPVPTGTIVRSPMDGQVLKTYFNQEGGNQLLIKHSNGMITGYAHLSKFLVQPGQKVSRGTQVALSGNTGRSTGPHLHFTLRDSQGRLLDPERFIRFE